MSGLVQKQTCAVHQSMSALPPITTLIALFGVSALGQSRPLHCKRTCLLYPSQKRTSKPSFPWPRPPLVNRTIGLVPVSRQNRCPPAVRFTPLVATNQAASIFGGRFCASLSFGCVASPKYFLPRLPQRPLHFFCPL